MPRVTSSETIYRAQAGIALTVGLGAIVAPRRLARLYGLDHRDMTGPGDLGWRLFGARNLVVGSLGLGGSQLMRDVTLAVQVPDQLVFAHAYRTRSIPRTTSVMAMLTSGAVIATGLAARRR